jgi:hypothetical protein
VPVAAPVAAPDEPSIIGDALAPAGTVLLSMVAFLIVAAALALPIGIGAAIGYAGWRGVTGGREQDPAEASGQGRGPNRSMTHTGGDGGSGRPSAARGDDPRFESVPCLGF